MSALNPYLHFDGNAEEAFTFYKSVFGGDFMAVARYKDAPPDGHLSDSDANLIMHIALPIGKSTLFGSDRPASFGGVNKGDGFFISFHADSEEETKRIYGALSAGGKVQMPLDKTFWGAYFGMFADKYGIQWMVNYDYNNK